MSHFHTVPSESLSCSIIEHDSEKGRFRHNADIVETPFMMIVITGSSEAFNWAAEMLHETCNRKNRKIPVIRWERTPELPSVWRPDPTAMEAMELLSKLEAIEQQLSGS